MFVELLILVVFFAFVYALHVHRCDDADEKKSAGLLGMGMYYKCSKYPLSDEDYEECSKWVRENPDDPDTPMIKMNLMDSRPDDIAMLSNHGGFTEPADGGSMTGVRIRGGLTPFAASAGYTTEESAGGWDASHMRPPRAAPTSRRILV